MRSLALSTLAVVLLSSPLAHAGARQKLAVLRLSAVGVDATTAEVVTNALVNALARDPAVEVLSASDLTALLTFEQQKQLAGCEESSCLVELGGSLGASHLVSGSVDRLGTTYILNAQVLDVAAARVVRRASERVKSDEELLAGVDRVAQALRAPAPQTPERKGTSSAATWRLVPALQWRVPLDLSLGVQWRGAGGLVAGVSAGPVAGTSARTLAGRLPQEARALFEAGYARALVLSVLVGWDFGAPDGLSAGLTYFLIAGGPSDTTVEALASATGQEAPPRDAPAILDTRLQGLAAFVAYEWVLSSHVALGVEAGLLTVVNAGAAVTVDTTDFTLAAMRERAVQIGATAQTSLADAFGSVVTPFAGVRCGWVF